jgi:hypothetical protein
MRDDEELDSVDPEDLAEGFDDTIPTREIDVDEDTEGDDGTDVDVEDPLATDEGDGTRAERIRGDEIELDLDEALRTGRTVAEAPEEE